MVTCNGSTTRGFQGMICLRFEAFTMPEHNRLLSTPKPTLDGVELQGRWWINDDTTHQIGSNARRLPPSQPHDPYADGDGGNAGDAQKAVRLFADIAGNAFCNERKKAVKQPLEYEEQPYGIDEINHDMNPPLLRGGSGGSRRRRTGWRRGTADRRQTTIRILEIPEELGIR
ncbi:hypothetical protein C7476_10297 [Phyllobacterium bourgognense]|uniref:Uncharacterized protein n=1 Tax=Phyllobacterium bourgognense TaxID=314236 RepID=A0A368Z2D3_9HYPH|nr:hypothetical protein C7476_10297 [Phyllobacterium bourgognense]